MDKKDLTEIHSEAVKRYGQAVEAEAENRALAEQDIRFHFGDQWDDDAVKSRDEQKRPHIVVNHLPQFTNRLIGDIRRGKKEAYVYPVDSTTDPVVALIYEGLLREIDYRSRADQIYETAAENAARCGQGFLRVYTDYAAPDSFDQEPWLKVIPDPMAVHFDPSAVEYDRGDAEWAFVETVIGEEIAKRKYGEDVSSFEARSSWNAGDKQVRVAEYFVKSRKEKTFWQVETPNGLVVIDPEKEGIKADDLPEESIKNKKTVDTFVIHRYFLAGAKVVSGPDLIPGQRIPIFPVYGPEEIVQGKRFTRSLIRHAIDPQKVYNFFTSSLVEVAALSPKPKAVGTVAQFKGFEDAWAQANTSPDACLTYNPDVMAPGRPEWSTPPQINQAAVLLVQQAQGDLRATTGIYETGLGMLGMEQSGVAIDARKEESDSPSIIFLDNLERTRVSVYRYLCDIIPGIYDTTRIVSIIGVDGARNWIEINGTDGRFSLDGGKYDIRLDSGPATKTQRRQALNQLMILVQALPSVGQVIASDIIKNMDFKGAQEAAGKVEAAFAPQPPPPPTPEEELKLANQEADLVGQRLLNEERARKLAKPSPTASGAVVAGMRR